MGSRTLWLVGIAVSAQLLAAGCKGGGGVFGGLFGGSNDSSGVFDVASFSGSGGGDSSGGSSGSGSTPEVATLHHPEPASLALFGSGLAGLGLLRRRLRKQRAR